MGMLQNLIDAHKFKTFLESEVDTKVMITEFVQLTNEQNRRFYVYLRIKPSQYLEYRRKVDIGDEIDPNQYEILEYGWGEPTAAQRAVMAEKYNVDHEFENKLREKLMKKKLEQAS